MQVPQITTRFLLFCYYFTPTATTAANTVATTTRSGKCRPKENALPNPGSTMITKSPGK